MIKVFITSFATKLPDPIMAGYLVSLPATMQRSILSYKRWQDRQRALLAKLLLRFGLQSFGFPGESLSSIQLDTFGRPFICREVDFNISHSGNFVICAMAQGQRVGIDIEAIQNINLTDFDSAFSAEQWDAITHAPAPHTAFFNSWTKKESASKADGRGLSIPLAQIDLHKNSAKIDTSNWHLVPLHIHPAYSCHLATDGSSDFKLTEIDCLSDLMVRG